MRRKDREVTDQKRIDEIIKSCEVCRVAFADGKAPYIVPMNFGYEKNDGKLILYFHGAKEGRKIDLIRRIGYAAFEMDTKGELKCGDSACSYTYMYASVMGEGEICLVEENEEKKHGLDCLMKHYTKKSDWTYDEDTLNRMSLMKLEVLEMTCKEH